MTWIDGSGCIRGDATRAERRRNRLHCTAVRQAQIHAVQLKRALVAEVGNSKPNFQFNADAPIFTPMQTSFGSEWCVQGSVDIDVNNLVWALTEEDVEHQASREVGDINACDHQLTCETVCEVIGGVSTTAVSVPPDVGTADVEAQNDPEEGLKMVRISAPEFGVCPEGVNITEPPDDVDEDWGEFLNITKENTEVQEDDVEVQANDVAEVMTELHIHSVVEDDANNGPKNKPQGKTHTELTSHEQTLRGLLRQHIRDAGLNKDNYRHFIVSAFEETLNQEHRDSTDAEMDIKNVQTDNVDVQKDTVAESSQQPASSSSQPASGDQSLMRDSSFENELRTRLACMQTVVDTINDDVTSPAAWTHCIDFLRTSLRWISSSTTSNDDERRQLDCFHDMLQQLLQRVPQKFNQLE